MQRKLSPKQEEKSSQKKGEGKSPPYFTLKGYNALGKHYDWNMRRWVLYFPELRHYLATKDSAKVVTSQVKARPDQALIRDWIIQRYMRRVQDEKARRDILSKVREDKGKLLLSKARAFLERRKARLKGDE